MLVLSPQECVFAKEDVIGKQVVILHYISVLWVSSLELYILKYAPTSETCQKVSSSSCLFIYLFIYL
jgi:hypothetical protein